MQVTQTELAEILGVSARTIRTWQKEGMPAGGDRTRRKYDTRACLTWVLENKFGDRPTEVDGEPPDPSYKEARAREKAAKAQVAELDLMERKGELIPVSVYKDELADVLTSVRSRLLNLPGRLSRELADASDPEAAERIVEQGVREALEELQRAYRERAQAN